MGSRQSDPHSVCLRDSLIIPQDGSTGVNGKCNGYTKQFRPVIL